MEKVIRAEQGKGLPCPSLEIARMKIRLRILDDASLPPFKGSTFRGVLGAGMLRAWCIAGREVCHKCRFVFQCPYANFFKPHLARGGKSVPVPFIVDPEMDKRTLLQSGDTVEFNFTVFGTATKWLPFAMAGLFRAGELGTLGVTKARFKIEIPKPPETEGDKAVPWEKALSTQVRIDDVANLIESKTQIRAIRLATPCKIKEEGRIQGEPDGGMLLKALKTRLGAISLFYGKESLGEGYWPWQERPYLNTGAGRLRWVVLERPSRTQRCRINIGGWIGTIPVESHNASAAALLKLGELIHVGKNTTVGCGKLVVEE